MTSVKRVTQVLRLQLAGEQHNHRFWEKSHIQQSRWEIIFSPNPPKGVREEDVSYRYCFDDEYNYPILSWIPNISLEDFFKVDYWYHVF